MASRRIILHVTDSELTAFEWDDNMVVSENQFTRDGMGIVQYGKYLEKFKTADFSIFLNSVEEEYQLKTMPHVEKRQIALLKNNIDRQYRQFTYKYGAIQGRQHFGKKEDIILLMSMTNDAVLDPWIQPILERKISISGIYSLPVTSENVVQELGIESSKLLLITLDSNGLRITYLDENKFKISRLVKSDKTTLDVLIKDVDDEVDKTLLYLGRLRLLFPDQKADVLFVGSKSICRALKNREQDSSTNSWEYFDSDSLSQKFGIQQERNRDNSVVEDLFTYTLLNSKVINHYANSDHTLYFRSRKLRLPMEFASASIFLLMALFSAIMYIDSQVLDTQETKLLTSIRLVESRLYASQSQLPDYPVSADAMSSGIQSVNTLLSEQPDMKDSLLLLSETIQQYSNIELDFLQWAVEKREIQGEEPEVKEVVIMDDPTEMADVDVNAEVAKKWVQVIILRGRLVKFGGNYTIANQAIDELVNSLGKIGKFHSVIATQKPINQTPEKRITGQAGKQNSKDDSAEFSLEIITDDSKLS